VASSGPALPFAIAQFAIAATLPVATIWLILHLDRVGERAVAFGRRWGLLPAKPLVTYEHPVERIAADLRRLSAAVQDIPHGTPHTRRKALFLAYDDTLIDGCRALGLPQCLSELPPGMNRELERLRVETSLESAGLRFRPVSR
jgi:hypothetical protein